MDFKNQEDYLLSLSEELKYLTPKDATKVLQFYQNKISTRIDYGENEYEVVNSLPDPKDVAKDAYESHGVKYLEIQKRKQHTKRIFNNILSVIVLILLLSAFIVASIVMFKNIGNKASLIKELYINCDLLDKTITTLGILCYIVCCIIILIYIFDLFYIIGIHFSKDLFKYKDESQKHKFLDFTLSGLLDEKSKKNKLLFNILLGFVIGTVFCFVCSGVMGGYLSYSMRGKSINTKKIELNDTEFSSLNIEASSANIKFETTTGPSYIEYGYSFAKDSTFELDNTNYNIKLFGGKKYDLLGILDEPEEYLYIYINNLDSNTIVNLNVGKGTIYLKDMSLSSLNVASDDNITMVNENMNIDSCSIEGIKVNNKFSNTKVTDFTYKAELGELYICDDSSIKTSSIENGSSNVTIEKVVINNLVLVNKAGSLNFSDLSGEEFNVTTRTSKALYDNLTYNKVTFDITQTASVTVKNSSLGIIDAKVVNSYFITDKLSTNSLTIVAENAPLFLNSINGLSSTLADLSVQNEGANSKTEIDSCNFENMTLSTINGYIIINDTTMKNGKIGSVNTSIIELTNIDGDTLELYLTKLSKYLEAKTNANPTIKIRVKKTDIISAANIQVNEKYDYLIEDQNG